MAVRLPDPHRSRAVLIGASQYEERDLTGIAAISNNLTDQLIVDSRSVVRTALIAADTTALRFLTSASGLPGAADEGR